MWNSNTYTHLPLQRGEIGYKLNLEADSVKVNMGGITGGFISLLQANAVDNVEMTVRTVIWDDVTDPLDVMIEFQGTGDIEFDRREVTFTFKSILDNLNIVVPKNLYQEQCNNRLYDTQCTLVRATYGYDGSASADGGNNFTLIDTVRGAAYQVPFDAGDDANPVVIGDIIGVGGFGGNNFSTDAEIRAWFRLESGALTIDSKGTNTLVNSGGVIADTTDYVEGAASGYFTADTLTITDANLDSGFPLKSGEANKDFTIILRVRRDVGVINSWLVQKYETAGNKRSTAVNATATAVNFLLGYSSGALVEVASHTIALSAEVWYDIAVTYTDSSKAWRIRIKNESTSAIEETTGNFTNNISITTADFVIGGTALGIVGNIDEVIVSSDAKSAADIDLIFAQNYGPAFVASTCLNIIYETSTTGILWYAKLTGAQFADDDVLSDGVVSVTLNGTPALNDDFYRLGEIEMTSGLNDGFRRMIVLSDEETCVIVNAFPNEIQSGDTYTIYPGCGQSSDACGDRFDNEINYTGYLHVPKPEEAMT